MHNKKFWVYLTIFITLNTFLFIYLLLFNATVPFSKFDYTVNAHHYFTDQRINGGGFNLLRALGQYDAQWYLKIANEGYPKNPIDTNLSDKSELDGMSYAFFPFYPLVLSMVNFPIKNSDLAAFLLANLLMLANFVSLFILIRNLSSENNAFKTIFLLFFFPFSIFYRSYFTEGLFLLLLVWFSYYVINKRWLLSALFLSLLLVTRPNGIILAPLFLFFLGKAYLYKEITMRTFLDSFVVSILPFIGWLTLCFLYTGNAFYWFTIQSSWNITQHGAFPLLHTISTLFHFFSLSWHQFHSSKIDVLTIVIVGIMLFCSRKKLKPELWLISLLLWLTPLLTKDTMSFTRYQIISFPLFMYLSQITNRTTYGILLSIFCSGLFFLSLFFVNWYWVG